MFKNMDSLYTEISEFFSFDKQKYTIEEFFGDIKTFKDDFMVSTIAMLPSHSGKSAGEMSRRSSFEYGARNQSSFTLSVCSKRKRR